MLFCFQSDTSIDSEDSCVSVIFVPHPENKLVQVIKDKEQNEMKDKKREEKQRKNERKVSALCPIS